VLSLLLVSAVQCNIEILLVLLTARETEGKHVPLVRKSLSPGMSLGNTPLPIRTGQRNLLMSSDEYPVRPEEKREKGGGERERVSGGGKRERVKGRDERK
jgi:hypothetical protein